MLGNLVIDYNESETMQYFSLYHLPNDLKDRRYIEPYIAINLERKQAVLSNYHVKYSNFA